MEVESEESEEAGGAGEPDPEEVYDYMDFDPFSFIKSLPPLEKVVPQWRKSLLPRQTRRNRRKTLVSFLSMFCLEESKYVLINNKHKHQVPSGVKCLFALLHHLFCVCVGGGGRLSHRQLIAQMKAGDMRLYYHWL